MLGPKKFPISSIGVLREIYRKGCFATNIASSVKLQNLSTKNMEPYLADVLRAIYYAQDVIELPATPKSSRAAEPVETEDSNDEDDDTSQLSVPQGVKGRRASKATSAGKGEPQMSQESDPPTGAARSSGALGGKKRKMKSPGSSLQVSSS